MIARTVLCCPCWAAGETAAPIAHHPSLRPLQRDGVEILASARGWLLADAPGVGKTAQALAALAARGYPPALVVCPPSVRRQWRAEAGRWAPGYAVTLHESGDWPTPPGQEDMVVTGYTGARKVPPGWLPRGGVVVLDEAQLVKSPRAQQTRGVRTLTADADATILLTATPAFSTAEEAWEVLRAGGLHRALHPQRSRWCELPEEEQERRLARVMTRRLLRDVWPDGPRLRWSSVPVSIRPRDAEAIEAALREAAAAQRLAREGGGRLAPAEDVARAAALVTEAEARAALEALAEGDEDMPLSTVRRLLASAKMPRAEELAAEHESSGDPLVVLCDHRAPVLALGRRPGWACAVGGQTPAERAAVVARFRAEGSGVAVTYGAGGTGLDGLQHRASRVILVDTPWTPAVLEQGLGRLVRMGQTGDSVLATLLVADHWVDEILMQVAARKLGAMQALGLELELAQGLLEVVSE